MGAPAPNPSRLPGNTKRHHRPQAATSDPTSRPAGESARAEFERFYRAEVDRLVAWLRRRTGDAGAGDDLAAETFARAFGGWDSYRGDGSRRSWLWRIARNTFANWVRDRVRHPTVPDNVPPADPADGADIALQQRAAVWELLAHVDGERARTAIYLRYVEGRSADEVADALDMTATAVRTLTHRSLQHLRAHLEEHA